MFQKSFSNILTSRLFYVIIKIGDIPPMPEKEITDCSKYIKIVESIYLTCRQEFDDNLVQDFAIEIINKIRKGLE